MAMLLLAWTKIKDCILERQRRETDTERDVNLTGGKGKGGIPLSKPQDKTTNEAKDLPRPRPLSLSRQFSEMNVS